ncbi:hypothetical protein CFC21_093921 [Triticum aestivum]|uniref:DUF7036 domain-containing protein n=5 Tax=Triticinae TaxID=1648030 RepID=A0A453PPQ6_AEGTS|nr:uncharacterized protein LOC109759905 [Aegilops tauschii subsp. strangulata]XP_044421084.1 uncharacterized protein LOC123145680 [Triticum aestivum]KAF7091322.1 hypothetical protein CFC21_093921 [Triticum aestivum]
MGKKAGDAEQAGRLPETSTSNGAAVRRCTAQVGAALSAKCVVALILGAVVFLSAFFMLLQFRSPGNSVPDAPGTLIDEIQAGFILLKPLAQLAPHAAELQQEINRQIGVPNTTVSVSMQALFLSFTVVEFDVLPDPINTSISARSMHALRKNLIQLTLQQLNLSLTPSVFGYPLCVQMLGFPGGITIELEPLQDDSILQVAQPIFNVTLDMSIRQLRGLIEEMKEDLGHLLDEDIYIDLTNKNGSTIAPPVIVQVSLSPDDRGVYEEMGRLKQLAEIITESSSMNLGLDPSVFGRIKDLKLAPRLQALVPSFAPSSSPTQMSFTSMPPYSQPMPSPSMPPYSQPSRTNLCAHCSCPAWMKLNATNPHRVLMQLPPMTISLQLPTQRHSGNGPGHKQSGNAMAAPTSIAPSSQP